jgi:heat shock protein HslJ
MLLLSICAVGAAGCGSDSSDSNDARKAGKPADPSDLLGTWSEKEAPKQSKGSVTFNDDKTAQVTDGCNRGATTFTTKGNQIKIKPAAMTMMACIDDKTGESVQNSPLPAALLDARFWKVERDTLTLTGENKNPVAELTRA